MTTDAFRQLALQIPDAVEAEHMNHPDFRVGGKVFASLGVPDDSSGMVKLSPEQQSDFIAKAPSIFTPSSGAWGRQGYTRVTLTSARPTIMRAALRSAANNVLSSLEKKRR